MQEADRTREQLMRWQRKISLIILACITALPSSGCRPSTPVANSLNTPAPKPIQITSVPPPPGIQSETIEPLSGDQLAAAQLSLEETVKNLPLPTYLADPQTDLAIESEPPPRAAQRFYAQGRHSYRQGRYFDAITKLQDALTLAPNYAPILQLLGRIHVTTKRAQAETYLRRAVRLNPDDIESLHWLGYEALYRGQPDTAVVLLARATELTDSKGYSNPAIWISSRYHLARALEQIGRDQAAIEQYVQFLDPPHRLISTMGFRRYANQNEDLDRRRHLAWRNTGDAYCRLNRPDQALVAYQQVEAFSQSERLHLTARVVYTHLRLGHTSVAQTIAIEQLKNTHALSEAIDLLCHVADYGTDRDHLAAQLRDVYFDSNRSADLALAIAAVLPTNAGRQLLREHLAARPADSAVLQALIDRSVSQLPSDPQMLTDAIRATCQAINEKPAAADRYSAMLLNQGIEMSVLLDALGHIDPQTSNQPAAQMLRGLALAHARKYDEALTVLQRVVIDESPLKPARIMLAKLLLAKGRSQQAAKVFQPLEDDDDPRVLALHVQILNKTGQPQQAIYKIDSLLGKYPNNLPLVLDKARLQENSGAVEAAEQTLLDKLHTHPRSEKLYERLFEIYETRHLPNLEDRYTRLVERTQYLIPNSWIAKLKRAQAMIYKNDPAVLAKAESLLLEVMPQRPNDYRPLDAMLELLWRTDRQAQANRMIEQLINQKSKERQLLRLAIDHYNRRAQNRYQTMKALTLLHQTDPPSEERAIALAVLHLRQNDPAKTISEVLTYLNEKPKNPITLIQLLRRALTTMKDFEQAERKILWAIDKFKNHRLDLMLELAMLYEQMKNHLQAEQVMINILQQDPDHILTNNSLGYIWANRGVNLIDSKAMIEKALASNPQSAAFRDSLGWVYYKLGQFKQAERELKLASNTEGGSNAIIFDHLGDVQFRLGQHDDAERSWGRALELFKHHVDFDLDPEMKDLDRRLIQKREALRLKHRPNVAPTVIPSPTGKTDPQESEDLTPQTRSQGTGLMTAKTPLKHSQQSPVDQRIFPCRCETFYKIYPTICVA